MIVIPAQAGSAFQQPNGWSSRASVFSCRDTATWLACRGLPSSCRRPGHFSLLAQRKVTKRKSTPMPRLPGLALQVRARVAGFADRASCPDVKLAGIHAGHPAGYSSTRPPRHRGVGEPKAKAKSKGREQRPRAKAKSKGQEQRREIGSAVASTRPSRP